MLTYLAALLGALGTPSCCSGCTAAASVCPLRALQNVVDEAANSKACAHKHKRKRRSMPMKRPNAEKEIEMMVMVGVAEDWPALALVDCGENHSQEAARIECELE